MVFIQIILNLYKKVPMKIPSRRVRIDFHRLLFTVGSILFERARKRFFSILAPANTLLLNPFYPGPSDIKSLFPIPSSSNMPIKSSPSPKTSSQRAIRRCHICQQDFRNKSLFRMHMNTFHPNDPMKKSSLTPSPILPSTNLGFLSPFVDTSSQLAQKIVTGQAPHTSYGIVNDSYFGAKMADRVVCEICNKQVCNKYFLKTHKGKS